MEIHYVSLYTVDASPLTKLDSLQEDQRVLVAASKTELMFPDSPQEYQFYDGQDCVDVAEWDGMGDAERCKHFQNLNEADPTTRNRLRFTRQWQAIQDDLAEGEMPPTKDLEALFEQRWTTSLDHLLTDAMKPPKLKTSGTFWDPPVVAALSVLASFTPGQSRLAVEHLEEAVHLRVNDADDISQVLQLGDVTNAISIIYERGGVILAKLTKEKSAKAREKERKKAVREKRKKRKNGVEE